MYKNFFSLWIYSVFFYSISLNSLFCDELVIKNSGEVLYNFSYAITENFSDDFINSEPKWTPKNSDNVNLGIIPQNLWIKLDINNLSPYQDYVLTVAFPLLDDVTFFRPTHTGFEKIQVGATFPVTHREIYSRNFSIFLNLNSLERKTYFIRVSTQTIMSVPIRVSRKHEVDLSNQKENFFFGIYHGAMFVMAFYNLFLFFSVRDISYLYYFCYVIFLSGSFLVANGLGVFHFYSDLYKYKYHISPIFNSLTGMFVGLFSRSFLNTKVNSKTYDKILFIIVNIFF